MTKEELMVKGVHVHTMSKWRWALGDFDDLRIIKDPTKIRSLLITAGHKPFPPKVNSNNYPYAALVVVDGPVVYLKPSLYLGPDQKTYVIFQYIQLKRTVDYKGRKIGYLTVSRSRLNSYAYGFGRGFTQLSYFVRTRFQTPDQMQKHMAGVLNSNYTREMAQVRRTFERKGWLEVGISDPVHIPQIKNTSTFKRKIAGYLTKGTIVKELFNG